MNLDEYKNQIAETETNIADIVHKHVQEIRSLINLNKDQINQIVIESVPLLSKDDDPIKKSDDGAIFLFQNGGTDVYLSFTGDIVFYTYDPDMDLNLPTSIGDSTLADLFEINENYLDTKHVVSVSPLLEKAIAGRKAILDQLSKD